jgi:DNA polymerase I
MKRIVLDIECNLKHDHIWLVVTKDIDTGEVNTWKQASSLAQYLKDVTLIVTMNGVAFDCHLLNKLWNTKIRLSQVYDLLLVSRLLDPSREGGHSLAAWGETLGIQKIDYRAVWLWLTDKSDKDTPKGQEFDEPHLPLLEDYCVRDVEVTEKLYHHLVGELATKGFSEYSVELEHKVASIIAQQTRNGFRLDVPYAISLVTTLKTRVDELLERAQELYPPETIERYSEKTGKRLKDTTIVFNMGSRQQVAEKLMDLGWKPQKHTDKGSIVVDEAVLDEIIKDLTCKTEQNTKKNGG